MNIDKTTEGDVKDRDGSMTRGQGRGMSMGMSV